MKQKETVESIQIERNEFRRAVQKAKKSYGDWLTKKVRIASRRVFGKHEHN